MAFEDCRNHPSPVMRTDGIDQAESQKKNIGSGISAKTFVSVSELPVSSRGGPAECDVHRRAIRSLATGEVIGGCVVDDTDNKMLRRRIPFPDNVRVELIMRYALSMFQRKGADIVDLYSQPCIA